MSKSAKGTEISRRKALGLLGLGVAGLSYAAPTATVLGQIPPTDKTTDKDKEKKTEDDDRPVLKRRP